jgi:hypothetical protein
MKRLAIGAFACLLTLGAACGRTAHNAPDLATPSATPFSVSVTPLPAATPIPDAQASAVIGAFGRLLNKFSSYADAEAVAGYHIPRSDLYPHPFTETTVVLRTLPRGEPGWRPSAESQYTYPPLAPETFVVEVGPSYDWGGDSTWTAGPTASIGDKGGWLIHGKFAYKCGEIDGVTLWCSIWGPAALPPGKLDEFIASVH